MSGDIVSSATTSPSNSVHLHEVNVWKQEDDVLAYYLRCKAFDKTKDKTDFVLLMIVIFIYTLKN